MSGHTPSLADVLDLYLAQDRAQFHVAVPGRVVSYDGAKQTVVVEPMTKVISRDADNERIVDTLPVLPAIPVIYPRGGGYFLAFPLVAGDGGLIVFTDTDLGAWRDSGGVSDPGDERRHGVGGAVFYPGLETVAKALPAVDHLVLGMEGSAPGVHVDSSGVHLGAAGGDPVVLAVAGPLGLVEWITQVTAAIESLAPGVILALPDPSVVAASIVKAT